MTEGYLLLAADSQQYLEYALATAISLKRHDGRPVCVCITENITVSPDKRPYFDHIAVLPEEKNIRGGMRKLAAVEANPFDRAMYLDSDCLLFDGDLLEKYWKACRGRPFSIEGNMATEGRIFVAAFSEEDVRYTDVETATALLKVDALPEFNGGVFAVEKGEGLDNFMKAARLVYEGPYRKHITYPYRREGEYADEPIISAAMATWGLQPLPVPSWRGRWQATTPGVTGVDLDVRRGHNLMVKKGRLSSGAIVHFCSRLPRGPYMSCVNAVRTDAGFQPLA